MTRKYSGKDFAKVLMYYNLVGEIQTSTFNIVCPFHDDINPSMRINLEENSFICFGCGLTGDVLTFVKLANPELNDLQACILLEKIVMSKEVKELNVHYKKKRRQSNKQALIEASDYFYGLRSVDWNNIRTDDERRTLEYMQDRGFTKRALNIADCRVNYNIAYPFVFPILDNGEFKGWVGRTTNKWTEKKRKYLYNDGFRKRDTLCGNYAENSVVFLCEGFMDYLSLRTRGHVKNCCALLGWHISDEQTKKLKDKGVTTVVSALDNDDKGNKGTEYLKRFFDVIRFPYPEGVKDTGEMPEEALKRQIKLIERSVKNATRSTMQNDSRVHTKGKRTKINS